MVGTQSRPPLCSAVTTGITALRRQGSVPERALLALSVTWKGPQGLGEADLPWDTFL